MTIARAGRIGPAPRRRNATGGSAGFAYGSILLLLAVIVVIVGFPLIYSFYLSLNRTNPISGAWTFVGADNYLTLLGSADFWSSLARTAYFCLLSVAGTTALGMLLALVLNERFAGRAFLRSVVLVPWAMAPVSVGVLWSFIYAGDIGPLNGLLHDLGLSSLAIPWLGDSFRALNLLTLTHVWSQTPLTTLMLLSAMQSIPVSMYRAATVDGAGPVRRFFAITLPWLKPTLLFTTILATINALMTFDLILVLTRGGPGDATKTLSWLGYQQSFQTFRFGEGAATLYVLTALSLVLAVLYFFAFRPQRSLATPAAATERAMASTISPRISLGQPPAVPARKSRRSLDPRLARAISRVLFRCGIVLAFAWSALPVLALLFISLSPPVDLIRTPPSLLPSSFTLDNYVSVLMAEGGTTSVQARRVPIALFNSFLVGVIVSVLNVALGTLAGYGFSRLSHNRFFSASLWVLLFTRMIPALTVVLPFFMIFRSLGLIDTHLGLVISYSTILLPLSAWMMTTTFRNIPVTLDRAAFVDGCTPAQMFWRVLLPVARPGVFAALIFCFLVSWNEFLFAMILTSTPNAQTIPVVIAGFLSQARFYEYGPLFAASVLSILPPVVITFLCQRYLIQGALSGAIKG